MIIYKTKHKKTVKKHYWTIYKENHLDIPNEVVCLSDIGLLGLKKLFATEFIIIYQKGEKPSS